MNDAPTSQVPLSSSLTSMLLVLTAAVACFIAWQRSGAPHFAVSGLGLLALAPVWYRSPILSFRTAFLGPMSARLTPRRRFSALDLLSTFIGYPLVALGIALWLFSLVRA